MEKKYDLIIIGGGAGGLTVALGGNKLKKKVLLIEKKLLGGECTWGGCIPSKSFISNSYKIKDNKTIFQVVKNSIEKIYSHETPEVLREQGIDVEIGEGKFIDKKRVEVNGKIFYGEKIIISTGSSPAIPKIKGLENIDFLTNENFFKQDYIPKSITFIGGGIISLELAFPLARLGSKVTILEKGEKILSFEEPEVSKTIVDSLEKNGIELILNVGIEEILKNEDEIEVCYKDGIENKKVKSEKIFVSAGRVPNTQGLNLDDIGIKYSLKGIETDNKLMVGKNIYAIGDAVGPYRFSHIAGYHGEIVIENFIRPLFKKKVDYSSVPWVTFTSPEYARVGLTEKEGKEKYGENLKIYALTKENDRSIISDEEYFMVKILCVKGKIIGTTVIGDRAGEILNIIQTLKTQNITLYKYKDGLQPYPTYGDILKRLAKEAYLDYLRSFPLIKLFMKK